MYKYLPKYEVYIYAIIVPGIFVCKHNFASNLLFILSYIHILNHYSYIHGDVNGDIFCCIYRYIILCIYMYVWGISVCIQKLGDIIPYQPSDLSLILAGRPKFY